jgi:hypothetical protein
MPMTRPFYEHTPEDDQASMNANTAFHMGQWQAFIGKEPMETNPVQEVVIAARYPSFYRHEHNQLTDEQTTKSKQLFNDVFDDLILYDLEKVRVYNGAKRPTARLSMSLEVDGERYVLSLKDDSTNVSDEVNIDFPRRDSEKNTREISIQRVEDGYGRENWFYRQGTDGIIRRFDKGDAYALRTLSRITNTESLLQASSSGLKSSDEYIENMRLNEDMGFNLQPVSPNELEGFRLFIIEAKKHTL